MKTRFCIFILTCLLAVGVVGCSTPEEVVTTNAPSPADAAQVKNTETKKEVQPPDQSVLTPVVPVRDPFVPLVVAAASTAITRNNPAQILSQKARKTPKTLMQKPPQILLLSNNGSFLSTAA
jgi:hypothetical protein